MEKTGVREISRRTGYSPATVSNVLNHKPGVSRKAIDAVLGAARELGLEPEDALIRITLAIARRGIQAIDQDDFYPVVVEGMRSQASARGLDVDFATIDLGRP